MSEKHYVGEIGTEVIVDCGCSIVGATDTTIKVLKPNGSEAEWPATIEGTDSLKYTTLVADFSVAGTYKLQASLTIAGWIGLGETSEFDIYKKWR